MADDNYYRIIDMPEESITGVPITITIERGTLTSNFTYSIGYNFTCEGTTTGEILEENLTGDTYTWTPSTAVFAPLMKNSAQGALEIFIVTYGTIDYYSTKTMSLSLNTMDKLEIAGLIISKKYDFNKKSISGITTHTLSLGIEKRYGAGVTVAVTVGDAKHVDTMEAKPDNMHFRFSFSLGTFECSSDEPAIKTIEIEVTDTRGRKNSVTTNIDIYKYQMMDIESVIVRNDNEKPEINFEINYQSIVAGDTNALKQFSVECISTDESYKTDLLGKTSPQTLNGTYELAKTYTFKITIQDLIMPSALTKTVILPSFSPVMDIGADGKTVTFFGTSPSSAMKNTLRIGEVASFGEEIALGLGTNRNALIGTGGLVIRDGSTVIGQIGYGLGKAQDSTVSISPFYTLGIRETGSVIGNYSYAGGCDVEASGHVSQANGYHAKASGDYSYASGGYVKASGYLSRATGDHAEASGYVSQANGYYTKASESYAEASGYHAEASGYASHANGYYAKAWGSYSYAEGNHTEASGSTSHAGGYYTRAYSAYQTVIGKYNIEDTASKYLLIVGNGNSNARSNAFCVNTSGAVEVGSGVWLESNNQGVYGTFTDGTNGELAIIANDNTLRYGYGAYTKGNLQTSLVGGNSIAFGLKTPACSWNPYITKGGVVTIRWTGAGYITSSGTQVNFTIPFAIPIVGTTTVSVSSSAGLIIRQNNKYLYGSSASAGARASSYVGTVDMYGVKVAANMPNTTNVTDNSSCGVDATVVLTFS